MSEVAVEKKKPHGPCDIPLCKEPWEFVALRPKPAVGILKRRCKKHWHLPVLKQVIR